MAWTCGTHDCVETHCQDPCRKQRTTLNRLPTGVGRYRSSMKKWGLADSAACECGEPEQTADHIINSCPLWFVKKWGLADSAACECGESEQTADHIINSCPLWFVKKWGLADSAACECGESEQMADHIINSCPLHRPRAGTNTPSDEYNSYREYRVANTNMYSRIHFFLRGY